MRMATENFPAGPESIAAHLDIPVMKSPMSGADGWCVRGSNTIIRINSSAPRMSQRFTLAHELAHLILGTAPDIATEPFRSDNAEERAADQLASELLIPDGELTRCLRSELPIDAKSLERLAKTSNVSPVMAACRVVSATHELGLQNAAIVFFKAGEELWRYSQGLNFSREDADTLLQDSLASKPNPARSHNADGNVVIGSLIDAQVYQVLLVQLLPVETASLETREERRRRLAQLVFADDVSFRQSVAGSVGIAKEKYQGNDIDGALYFFNERYVGTKYTGDKAAKLQNPDGQEFLRMSFETWFS